MLSAHPKCYQAEDSHQRERGRAYGLCLSIRCLFTLKNLESGAVSLGFDKLIILKSESGWARYDALLSILLVTATECAEIVSNTRFLKLQ